MRGKVADRRASVLLKEEPVKAGIVIPNTYRDAEALTAVSMGESMSGKAPARSMFDPKTGQRSWEAFLKLATQADELGLDHISVSEHHFFPFICEPNPALVLAALSQVVRRATLAYLGPIVSVNNPVRVAEEIAMLDQMSGGGRVIAYLLKGTPNEFMYYGHTADEARERAQEAALLIKKALTEPEPFAWEGKFWKFPVVSVWPGNTTKQGLLLYTSGSQQETIDFAARNGFGMTTGGHPDYVKQMALLYKESCRAAGWTPGPEHVLSRGMCIIGDSDEHAEEILGRMLPNPSLAGHMESVGSASSHDTTGPAAGGPGKPAFIFPVLLKGSPATVIEQARALAEAGIGVLDLIPDFGGLELEEIQGIVRRLGTEVLPAIRAF